MGIMGLRATDSFDSDARPLNWRAGVLWRYPNGKAPLTGLTSLMSKRSTDDPEFNWWQQVLTSQKVQLGADAGTGTTLTVVADPAGEEVGGAKQLVEGHILWAAQTGELMMVTADPANDTTVEVVRSWGAVAATTIDYDGANVNPYLYVVGNAFEEGSDAPTAMMYDPTKYNNYTQIFRNTLEATRTALKTRLRTWDLAMEAKRQCAELHSIEMEKAFWWGEAVETTKNGKPIRTTRGVLNFIDAANVKNAAGGSIDMDTLEEYLYEAFRFGSDEKMGFCGNRALLTINQVVRKNTSMQIFSGIKEFGMRVTRLDTPFGSLVLKTHPLFNQIIGGENPTTGGGRFYSMNESVVILDMAEFVYRYLDDSDTKYQPVLQDNGIDGKKSGYLTECGLEVHHGKNHYRINQLAVGAADT